MHELIFISQCDVKYIMMLHTDNDGNLLEKNNRLFNWNNRMPVTDSNFNYNQNVLLKWIIYCLLQTFARYTF